MAWALGLLVVVLVVALVALGAYVLATGDDDGPTSSAATTTVTTEQPTAQPTAQTAVAASTREETTAQTAAPARACDPAVIAREAGIEARNVNVDLCLAHWALAHVYVAPGAPAGDTQYILRRTDGHWVRYTNIPSNVCRQDALDDGMPARLAEYLPECAAPQVSEGDLGLATPMARPSCDGRGIVVLHSAVTPGAYATEIRDALATYPAAGYLRADMACPSLRQRDQNGNPIYAVFRPSGYTRAELCSDVRAAGGAAYGRWLDTTSDPTTLVTC